MDDEEENENDDALEALDDTLLASDEETDDTDDTLDAADEDGTDEVTDESDDEAGVLEVGTLDTGALDTGSLETGPPLSDDADDVCGSPSVGGASCANEVTAQTQMNPESTATERRGRFMGGRRAYPFPPAEKVR